MVHFNLPAHSALEIWWRFDLDRECSTLLWSACEAAAWCLPDIVTQGRLPRSRLRRSGGPACESAQTRQGPRPIESLAERQNRAAPSDFCVSDLHANWSDALFQCTRSATPSIGRSPGTAVYAPHVAQGALWRLREARGPGRPPVERSVTPGVACWALSVTGNNDGRPTSSERGGDRVRPPVLRAYGGVVPPARPSKRASLEACGPLCDLVRGDRVVAPRARLELSRWWHTLFVGHLWAGAPRRGNGPGTVTRFAPREEP